MAEDASRTSVIWLDRSASPLLRSKLRRPAVPQHHVPRERLVQLLDDASTAPLTLVVAPAGAGKTTLVSAWAAGTSHPTSWLSLDDADRDGGELWRDAIAALEVLRPGCGERALGLLRRSGPMTEVVGQLVADLADVDDHGDLGAPHEAGDLDADDARRSTLVVDDLHLVEDDEVAASIAAFVQHLPPGLHVVALSRRDPALPIDRLRARGLLREVRMPELRFSSDEAHQMLSRLAPTLSTDELDAASSQVGGWAAGLQLTALAARSRAAHPQVGARTGTVADDGLLVDDYVWREVLEGEDDGLIDTLLDVAVVDRVNAGLGRALTGRDDADRVLLDAEARGLFVTRLGPGGWFSVHSLVRSVLLAELGRRSAERVAEQHVRAARWFEDQDEVPAALDHWLLADRPRDALRVLAASVTDLYDSGREATIRRTISRMPPALAGHDVDAMIELAWCHLLFDRPRFVELVGQATWWAGRSPLDGPRRARLAILESIAATVSGRWAEGGRVARQAMEDLGDVGWRRDPIGRIGWNIVARGVALSERWDDAGDEVREVDLALGSEPRRHLAFQGTRALGHALAGRPTEALVVAAGVRRAAATSNMTILRAELALAEAVAHRELCDHDRALPELVELARAPAEATLYCRVRALLELAEAHLDADDLDRARAAFEEAQVLVDAEAFGAEGRDWLPRTGTRLALAAGRTDKARRWADTVEDPFWKGVSLARVGLAAGVEGAGGPGGPEGAGGPGTAAAAAALRDVVPRCVRHEVVLGLLRARTAPDRDAAAGHVAAAVELASANGLLQTVASDGPDVVELVERSAWQVPAQWLDRLRRATAESSVRPPAAGDAGTAVEALTDRERDVLRFLASRLTVNEIADELYVSVNTLKFHLKAIYRKLGVKTRAEAAEAARRMTALRRQP